MKTSKNKYGGSRQRDKKRKKKNKRTRKPTITKEQALRDIPNIVEGEDLERETEQERKEYWTKRAETLSKSSINPSGSVGYMTPSFISKISKTDSRSRPYQLPTQMRLYEDERKRYMGNLQPYLEELETPDMSGVYVMPRKEIMDGTAKYGFNYDEEDPDLILSQFDLTNKEDCKGIFSWCNKNKESRDYCNRPELKSRYLDPCQEHMKIDNEMKGILVQNYNDELKDQFKYILNIPISSYIFSFLPYSPKVDGPFTMLKYVHIPNDYVSLIQRSIAVQFFGREKPVSEDGIKEIYKILRTNYNMEIEDFKRLTEPPEDGREDISYYTKTLINDNFNVMKNSNNPYIEEVNKYKKDSMTWNMLLLKGTLLIYPDITQIQRTDNTVLYDKLLQIDDNTGDILEGTEFTNNYDNPELSSVIQWLKDDNTPSERKLEKMKSQFINNIRVQQLLRNSQALEAFREFLSLLNIGNETTNYINKMLKDISEDESSKDLLTVGGRHHHKKKTKRKKTKRKKTKRKKTKKEKINQ